MTRLAIGAARARPASLVEVESAPATASPQAPDVFARCGAVAPAARDVFAAITAGRSGGAAMLESLRAACWRSNAGSAIRLVLPHEVHVEGLASAVGRLPRRGESMSAQELFVAGVRAAAAASARVRPAGEPFARIGGRELPTLGIAERSPTFWPFLARELAGPLTNPDGRVERVLYTGGAHDVAAAFSFFEGPKGGPSEVVIVDVQGFGAPEQILAKWRDAKQAEVFCSVNAREGFTCTDDGWGSLRSVGCVAPAALWQLEQLGATDVSITYFDGQGRPLDADAVREAEFVDTHHKTDPIELDRSIGAVELRATVEGQPRRVTWIRADANDLERYPQRLRRELGQGFDAAIMKGAYFTLSKEASVRLGESVRGEGLVVGDSSVEMLGAKVVRELPVRMRWDDALYVAKLR